MNNQEEVQFITCPKCEGRGRKDAGGLCSDCLGLGLGSFFQGKFLYWNFPLGKATIKLRHIKNGFHLATGLIAYAIGILGVVSLVAWLYIKQNSLDSTQLFLFWRTKHYLILFFWISVVADMFIIYRLGQEKFLKKKIKESKSKRNIKLPNNWEELKIYKNKINVSGSFDNNVIRIIEKAFLLADKLKHRQVLVEHLAYYFLQDREMIAFFVRLNVDKEQVIKKINNQLAKNNDTAKNAKLILSNEVKEVLIEAYTNAYQDDKKEVSILDLVLPSVKKGEILAEVFYDSEITEDKVNNVLKWFSINERLIAQYKIYKKMARLKPSNNMNKSYTAVATPVLDHYSHDLTIAAKWGRLDICVAREKEIEKIFQAMESGYAGIILTGLVGIGKQNIVHGIAQLMVEENVPYFLKDKRLVELNIARLVGGATPAQAEERLLVVIDEAVRAGNVILHINDLDNLVGITAGKEGSLELSEVLASALEKKKVYCLAVASDENYIKQIRGGALDSVMSKLEIKEPDKNQAIQMIESKIGFFENKYKAFFSYNAIEQAVDLSIKYIHDRSLPEKAIEVLELAAVRVSKNNESSMCRKEDIAEIINEKTGILVSKATEDESEILLNLETNIKKRMIGQSEAVKTISDSLRRARVNLREEKRPIASFLFLGPTGVGKTELAKTVAEVYFGNEKDIIRLDMSEYQHQDSIKKIIGDASNKLGYLTEKVKKKPFSLILLDEFEKANSDILNLFLQVMDDGRLTDGGGKTVDFTNCIIVATSNAGAIYIQEEVSQGTDINEIKQVLIEKELNKVMRPELINRFDGIIVFKPLDIDNMIEIVKLMLDKIKIMLDNKGILMSVSDEAIMQMAQQGYDPKFGARPLRRLLQDKIENKIATKILASEINRRDTVVIDDNLDVLVMGAEEL